MPIEFAGTNVLYAAQNVLSSEGIIGSLEFKVKFEVKTCEHIFIYS